MNNKEEVKKHFDRIAAEYDYWKKKADYYYFLIKSFYKKNIPPGSKVVEFGCATAEILASCQPKRGLGVDISSELLELARKKYPQYEFKVADVENFVGLEKFDYCIMSDLIDHLLNIPAAIESASNILNPTGKLIITTINPIWNPVFGWLEKLKLKMPEGPHCFVPNRVIEFLCQIKGFKTISKGALIFIPKKIPFLSDLANNIIPGLPLVHRLCWVQTLIVQKDQEAKRELSYSVVIPVYNEEKNIQECITKIPRLNRNYEIIAIDDGSEDASLVILEKLQKEIQNLKVIRFAKNRGKAQAIEEGIRQSSKDIVVILDADMSVATQDILLFIEALERGLGEFINGTRLIYNMEKQAMAQVKRVANFSLALLLSLVLKFRITDALCGTKAFFKKDFQNIKISGERWGDLVLLWTAERKGLKVREIPVRYYPRKSGQSKMRFFSDGMKFMRYSLNMAVKEFFGCGRR